MANIPPMCVWDITIPSISNFQANEEQKADIMEIFDEHCKKWCFQLELGSESGYAHYQCRISLKLKARITGVVKLFKPLGGHVSLTSSANRDNDFYVTKEEGRAAGPWADNDPEPVYIPIQYLHKWNPGQTETLNIIEIPPTKYSREIAVMYDPMGGQGKSALAGYIKCSKIGMWVPCDVEKSKDMAQLVCSHLISLQRSGTPFPKVYIIDIPRNAPKSQISMIYKFAEQLKNGIVYDTRNKYTSIEFDVPHVMIFTNSLPEYYWLSADRWDVKEFKSTGLTKIEMVKPEPKLIAIAHEIHDSGNDFKAALKAFLGVGNNYAHV